MYIKQPKPKQGTPVAIYNDLTICFLLAYSPIPPIVGLSPSSQRVAQLLLH